MNCSECEQLFDACLDGQLAGSLRLEFDAHRLRCQRCQQSLAMLEAVGHIVSSDQRAPELADDFVNRVMRGVKRPQPGGRVLRFPLTRVAIVAGAVLQAAAILTFAIIWNDSHTAPSSGAGPAEGVISEPDEVDLGFAAIRDLIVERVEEQVWDMHAAGWNLTSDLVGLARYLDIAVPDDVARESSKIVGRNPLDVILDFGPGEEDEPLPTPPTDNVHSI